MSDEPSTTPKGKEYYQGYNTGYKAGQASREKDARQLYDVFDRHAFRLVAHLDTADRELLREMEARYGAPGEGRRQ